MWRVRAFPVQGSSGGWSLGPRAVQRPVPPPPAAAHKERQSSQAGSGEVPGGGGILSLAGPLPRRTPRLPVFCPRFLLRYDWHTVQSHPAQCSPQSGYRTCPSSPLNSQPGCHEEGGGRRGRALHSLRVGSTGVVTVLVGPSSHARRVPLPGGAPVCGSAHCLLFGSFPVWGDDEEGQQVSG